MQTDILRRHLSKENWSDYINIRQNRHQTRNITEEKDITN